MIHISNLNFHFYAINFELKDNMIIFIHVLIIITE